MQLSLEKAGLIPASEPYFDLGNHGWKVTTSSPDAQTWFNRGLVWAYSFNQRESAACFQQAISHDPDCCMAYWGVAFASGPNYNKVWAAFDQEDLVRSREKCYDFSRQAKEHASSATPVEKALIDALILRFPPDVPEDFTPWVLAYSEAMHKIYKEFGGDDLDLVTIVADAMMNTAPWNLYDSATGLPNLATPVMEIHQIMDKALKHPGAKKHPGTLHMYIHLVEMSKDPERAIVPADYLRDLVPDGGHMHHMPSHIDILIGDYRRSMYTNNAAALADEKYYQKEGGENFYSFYRMHNYHSLIYAAMMAGNATIALDATSRMEATLTEGMLRVKSPRMADWLEFFNSVRVHVYIRFGMWTELKALTLPKDQELYCCTTAFTYYGRGIAYAATGNVISADKEREHFRAAALRVAPTRMDFPNKVVDILKVAAAMLDGEIDYRKGDYPNAYKNLRLAIECDDALIYSEPWSWMLPARHPYAALMLEQGHVEDACKVYAEDLGLDGKLHGAHRHPNNVWALHGYHECLLRLGRTTEAQVIQGQLRVAAGGADIAVESSCFCRLDTFDVEKNQGESAESDECDAKKYAYYHREGSHGSHDKFAPNRIQTALGKEISGQLANDNDHWRLELA